jgi:hypothetical protein
MRVNAAEAARLADRSERRVREWIQQGKLRAEPSGPRAKGERIGPSAWSIDVDDLAAVPGITISRERLAELAAGRDRTPAGLLARVETLERQVRTLLARARFDSEGANAASRYADVAPAQPPESHPTRTYTGIPGAGGMKLLAHFARDHGMSGPTAKDQRAAGLIAVTSLPNTSRAGELRHFVAGDQERDILTYWRDHWTGKGGHALKRCDDPLCACHALLTAGRE